MGGAAILKGVGDALGREAFENIGKYLAEDSTSGWYRSSKAILEKTPIGKTLSDYIENKYEPMLKQTAQRYLDTKIANKVAPHIAAEESYKEATHDVRKTLFGQNDEVLIKAIHTATKQHGVAYGNTMADIASVYFHDANSAWRNKAAFQSPTNLKGINLKDVGIKRSVPFTPSSEAETGLRAALSWMYTPLIAIPHMSQVANIVYNEGIKSTSKAIAEYSSEMAVNGSKSKVLNNIIQSGALYDEIRFQMLDDAKGGGIARKLFHHPGFGWVRRQELNISAVAGKNSLEDAAQKLKVNPNDKWAIHTIQRLGLQPQDISQGITPEHIQKAMYNAANQAIFIKSELNLPYKWEGNFYTRMGFQYKQFAFRQGQFIAKGFQDAYNYGGMKQVAKNAAILGTLFPAFGEVVHSLENLAVAKDPKQRDYKNPYVEYFDAMGHAAAFGMVYSMFRSGMWNFGKGFLEGPLMSTIDDLLIGLPTHVVKAGVYKSEDKPALARKQVKSASRLVLSKLSVPGRIAANLLKEPKKEKE
jgi:hypothetical protein